MPVSPSLPTAGDASSFDIPLHFKREPVESDGTDDLKMEYSLMVGDEVIANTFRSPWQYSGDVFMDLLKEVVVQQVQQAMWGGELRHDDLI